MKVLIVRQLFGGGLIVWILVSPVAPAELTPWCDDVDCRVEWANDTGEVFNAASSTNTALSTQR